MPLPDGETLLAKTAARALALPGVAELVTVTNREYYFHTKDAYAGHRGELPERMSYLLEPFGRNTAPAVALAALWAERRHGDDVVLLVLPADHLVRDHVAFAAAVARAARLAQGGSLVTFGIAPTHPETGFGYIECGAPVAGDGPPAFTAVRFVEKPPARQGPRVRRRGQLSVELGDVLLHADGDPRRVRAPCAGGPRRRAARRAAPMRRRATIAMLEIDAALFASAPDISLDYAVMEEGGDRRRGRGRARRVRLERRRLVAGDGGSVRAGLRKATMARASASPSRPAAPMSTRAIAWSRPSVSRI